MNPPSARFFWVFASQPWELDDRLREQSLAHWFFLKDSQGVHSTEKGTRQGTLERDTS